MFVRLTRFFYKPFFLFIIGAAIIIFAISRLSNYFGDFYSEPYKIGVIVNSVEITAEDMAVLRFVLGKKLEEINAAGGINGRSVDVLYMDDKGSNTRLFNLVQAATRDTSLIAFIGCNTSDQFKVINHLIGSKNIPFIGGTSLPHLYEKYPNIYSAETSIKQASVVLKDLLQNKSTKTAFIGRSGDYYSRALLEILEQFEAENQEFKIAFRRWYPLGYIPTPEEMKNLADSLKQQADFILLSSEPKTTNAILNGLWTNQVKMPVFTGKSDISQVDLHNPFYKTGELYDIFRFAVPGVQNTRLQEQFAQFNAQLKPGKTIDFQLGFAGRHADEIGLIKEASLDNTLPKNAGVRDKINAGLKKYINGRRIYRGWYADWFFTPERGFSADALLAWKPKDFSLPIMAPLQFLRTDSGYRQAPVLYLDLDLESISQINDEEGTFYASLYLELSSIRNLTLAEVEFSNAVRNKINQQPLIEARLIRQSTDSTNFKFNNYLYKIDGKFLFNPNLKKYPFDEQKFPIVIQTSNTLKSFLVQPTFQEFRDTVFESPGWIYQKNYVGFNQDIISVENIFEDDQKHIPIYKFSFVYELKRARIDFNLKTLVPLLAILIITYLSAYIPAREFEALCAIQVTALLSAIALYFSTYKPEMQYATVSDTIFIFTYVMITSLIGTSILIYTMYRKSNTVTNLARLYQQVLFPIIVIVFTLYIRA